MGWRRPKDSKKTVAHIGKLKSITRLNEILDESNVADIKREVSEKESR